MRLPLIAACLAAVLTAGVASAQTTSPDPAAPTTTRHRGTSTTSGTPTPATSAPTTSAPGAPAATPVPSGTKVNLNTATAAQLDSLPTIGKARLKVIMTERAKGPFKDWDDFDRRMQHTSVNAGVRAKIKDLVTF